MLRKTFSVLNFNNNSDKQDNRLRGATLQQQPGYKQAAFVDELNENGCYIHATSTGKDKINAEINKIEEDAFPTPATHVGIGPFRLYDTSQWKNASGFVFSPNAISTISYKYDFWSNRLKNNCTKGLKDYKKEKFFRKNTRDEAAQLYAMYIREKFNTLNQPTQSRFHSISKNLTVKSDIIFDKAKYREMELRSSLAYRDSSTIKDISSKFMIADLVATPSKPIANWSKGELLAELRCRISGNDELKGLLEHALIKIESLDQRSFAKYLQDAASPAKRKLRTNFYTDFIKENQTLGPNEHLIMPTLADIVGVYVNVSAVDGIDHAFDIKSKLEERQKKRGITQHNPALLYHPVNRTGKTIMQARWSHQMLPWSTKGLIEFAKTGKVTAEDGIRFTPNHFLILTQIGDTASINNFISDLSKIKSDGNNLLHLALKSNRKLDDIKLFYFWNVSPQELNTESKSVLSIAKETHPEAFAFLTDAVNWTAAQRAHEKNEFLLTNLKPLENACYMPHNGKEEGKAKFIPEIGEYRVMDGRKFLLGNKTEIGHRRYIPILKKTTFGAGCITEGRHVTHRGIWKANGAIGLGYQYAAANKVEGEKVTFIGEKNGSGVNITLSNIKLVQDFYSATLECSLDSGSGKQAVQDSCFYLKANCKIPKEKFEQFKDKSGNKIFRFIEIDQLESVIEERSNTRIINVMKYHLAHIRYHRWWMSTENMKFDLGTDEMNFIKKYTNTEQIEQMKIAIRDNKIELLSLYDSLDQEGLTLLKQEDRYGNCLYKEIRKYIKR